MNIELLGFIAGGLVAVSLFPQVIKSHKTKSTQDISLAWNTINVIGQILWLIYGVIIGSISLYIMSGVTLLMALSVLVLKLRFDGKSSASDPHLP